MRPFFLLALAACGRGTLAIPSDDPATEPAPTEPAPTEPGCADITPAPEGAFLERQVTVSAELPACRAGVHAFAGARGSAVHLHWSGPDATLEIVDLLGNTLGAGAVRTGGAFAHLLDRTGEHLVRVHLDAPELGGSYALTATCLAGCDLRYTRHPLVLMHGMAGTESFLGELDYWYGVVEHLEPLGYAVHVGTVDPFQPSPVRAAQWAAQLDALAAAGLGRRFNLIGHSQGGIDARLVASALDPEHRVVSVTTISTPHHGTVVADVASGVLSHTLITPVVVDGLFDLFTAIYDTDDDQDIVAQLDQLSSHTMAQFNADVPDRPDVAYASWAGRTCALLDVLCQLGNGGEIVTPLFGATHLVIGLFEGANDGLVSVDSARWGEFLGELPADHLDEVGLFPGTTAPGWDHLAFFADEAARHAGAGR